MATKRMEPRAVVGHCRLPGCGKPVAWDPARTVRQNTQNHYCGPEHRAEMNRLRRRARTERERAEVAAGTRAPKPSGATFRGPDGCEAEAAKVNAYWASLGYDVKATVVLDDPVVGPGGKARRVRRVRSELVAGKPPGASWGEVQERMLARAERTDAARGGG